MNARKRWARRLIAAAETPIPRYGSAEWLVLPEGDARKVAAVVVAAELWAHEADELEERLRVELDLARRAFKATEDAEYAARAAAHRQTWEHLPASVERQNRAREYRRDVYGEGYGSDRATEDLASALGSSDVWRDAEAS
ncbi:MAG: hypothetical protein JWR35_616 [Marmoricola sp.]|nr:hypothetical protein [Marmoricola sp.]